MTPLEKKLRELERRLHEVERNIPRTMGRIPIGGTANSGGRTSYYVIDGTPYATEEDLPTPAIEDIDGSEAILAIDITLEPYRLYSYAGPVRGWVPISHWETT
jgi:hypothetical protein